MAFLEIDDHGRPAGWITLELFETECPKACYNFRMLCTGELGVGKCGRPLHYKGTSIFRIIPGFMIQGGDIVNDNGTSGESAYRSTFFDDDESPFLHDQPGLLCTASLGRPNTNTSQFYITTAPCPWQDGRDVIFGRIIGGMKVMARLEQMGSARGTVNGDVRIANCGLLPNARTPLCQPIVLSAGSPLEDVGDMQQHQLHSTEGLFHSTALVSTDQD